MSHPDTVKQPAVPEGRDTGTAVVNGLRARIETMGNGILVWLSTPSPPLLASLLAAILIVDALVLGNDFLPLHGFSDEIGHASTGLIWILAARSVGIPVHLGAGVAASMMIDLDHVPYILDWLIAPAGISRPVTHSLLTAMVLSVVGIADRKRRSWWIAATIGIVSHLARDMATGEVRLWWPLNEQPVSVSYGAYIGITCMLALLVLMRWPYAQRDASSPAKIGYQETPCSS